MPPSTSISNRHRARHRRLEEFERRFACPDWRRALWHAGNNSMTPLVGLSKAIVGKMLAKAPRPLTLHVALPPGNEGMAWSQQQQQQPASRQQCNARRRHRPRRPPGLLLHRMAMHARGAQGVRRVYDEGEEAGGA